MFNQQQIPIRDTATTASTGAAYGSDLGQRFGTARSTILQAQQDIHQLVEAQKAGSAAHHSDQQLPIRATGNVDTSQLLRTSVGNNCERSPPVRSTTHTTGAGALAMPGLNPNSLALPAVSMPQQPHIDTYNQILTQIYGFDNPASLLGLQQIFNGGSNAAQQQPPAARLEGGASSFPPQLQGTSGGLAQQEAQSSALKQEPLTMQQQPAVGALIDQASPSQKDPSGALPPDELRTLVSAGVRIKGRTPTELKEKAVLVKKRRKESAARSRARKTQAYEELEGENRRLHEENERLKSMLSVLEIQFRQRQEKEAAEE